MTRRQAVSILLTRDPQSTEVYLVERSPELKFFGGYFAFPGGTLDPEDADVKIQNANEAEPETLPFLIAAAREVFEETGVLLARGAEQVEQEKLRRYRRQLLADEIPFTLILQQEHLCIDAADFHFICAILTPEFAPVRYDTRFYYAQIPPHQTPEIWSGELVRGHFYSAKAAADSWKKGEMFIVPPVIFMLNELVGRSIADFVPRVRAHAEAYRQGKIHQIYFTPGVQMIPLKTRTLAPATHTNAYLVGEKELYLIDPAPSDADEQARLWAYLDDRLQEGRTLKGILLTHHHGDHIGAAAACQQRYRLPMYAHEATAGKLGHLDFAGLLEPGQELELGESPDGRSGWKLRVFHTPGHASGHLAFQESRYGALIAGDLVSTLSTIVIGPSDGHLASYMRSLKMMAEVTHGTIYPAHGPAVKDGRQVLEYFIRHRQERENRLLAALQEQPRSLEELLPEVYNDVPQQTWPLARHSLQAGLIKLIEEGRCEQAGSGYRKI